MIKFADDRLETMVDELAPGADPDHIRALCERAMRDASQFDATCTCGAARLDLDHTSDCALSDLWESLVECACDQFTADFHE